MELSNEVLVIVGFVVLAVLGGAVYLWRTYFTLDAIERAMRKLAPDEVEALVLKVTRMAYDAVEQYVKAYEDLTSEQKQELALRYARALILLLLTGKMTPLAAEATLESNIYRQRNYRVVGPDVSLEVKTHRAGSISWTDQFAQESGEPPADAIP